MVGRRCSSKMEKKGVTSAVRVPLRAQRHQQAVHRLRHRRRVIRRRCRRLCNSKAHQVRVRERALLLVRRLRHNR